MGKAKAWSSAAGEGEIDSVRVSSISTGQLSLLLVSLTCVHAESLDMGLLCGWSGEGSGGAGERGRERERGEEVTWQSKRASEV